MCPVAPGIPGISSLYAVHDGKIYIFATSGCIDAFKSNPDSYL
jgi:YHS domain-containing protein